ncbi:MAG: SufD family Fe-S cluster assembly protein [Steroidobacteraceae bacterium]
MSDEPASSQGAWEKHLRTAIMQSAPLLDAKTLPVDARSRAIEKALAAGLPGLRSDTWRYSDLRYLASVPLAPLPLAPADIPEATELPERLEGFTRLVFANGRYIEDLSDRCPELLRRSAALLPERTLHERFGWLNDAFATDVARLVVGSERRIELLFVTTDSIDAQSFYPRLEVTLEAGAALTLVERHLGTASPSSVVNAAVQVFAARGSHCRHLRWQQLASNARLLDTLQIALDQDSTYELAQLALGAQSARSSVRAALFGAGARLAISGVSLGADRRRCDTSLRVDHIAPHTVSDQIFRALANERARIACASRVEVLAGARGASSTQSLRGLLGAGSAEIDLRPQLEIHTDEVKATHGATTGALDANTLFYLLSRGLEPATARQLLEWAFLEDAISRIGDATLRRLTERAVLGQLGNTAASEALQ